jgi:nucleoside-diphosphate-sugar epimerase
MSKIILITGATGFVGKQVVNHLLEMGYRCRLVIRRGHTFEAHYLQMLEAVIETEDVFNEHESFWEKALTGVDILIHIAWYAEPGKYLTSAKNTDCLIGSIQLFNFAAKFGVQKIVGIGTCFEYDFQYQNLTTLTPLKPATAYARNKVALFYALQTIAETSGIDYNWCRLFYLYGEGEDKRKLIASIREKLAKNEEVELTSGVQTRDYIDIKEAGKIIAEVALHHQLSGAFNVCSGIPITVKELAIKVAMEYGKEHLLKFGTRQENLTDPPYLVGVRSELVKQ